MSITGPIKTPAQVIAERIYAINVHLLQVMQDSLSEGYNTFWHNSHGVTPQEVADALGTDAAAMMEYHQRLGLMAQEICAAGGVAFEVPLSIPDTKQYALDSQTGLLTISKKAVNVDPPITVDPPVDPPITVDPPVDPPVEG